MTDQHATQPAGSASREANGFELASPDQPDAANIETALARNRAFASAGGHKDAVVFPSLRLFVITSLDLAPADAKREEPDGHSIDATQGRQIGSDPDDDGTQGRQIGSSPSEDPTQGRQIGSSPYEDAAQGRQIGSSPYEDATEGRQIGSRPYDDATQARGYVGR